MIRRDDTDLTLASGGECLRVAITGEIDHHSAYTMREKIDLALYRERPRCLILDFAGVTFMDSSGLGLILGRLTAAGEIGTTLRLTGISSRVMKILLLAGIDRLPGLEIEGVNTKVAAK